MRKSSRKKTLPKRVLRLPDLDYAKGTVLNTLGSPASKRAYGFAIDDFVTWYCSEPRLAFSRPVVLRYRLELEARRIAPATINLRLAAVRRLAYEAADTGLLSTGTGRRHPAREGRQTDRRATWELVDGRPKPGRNPGAGRQEFEGPPRQGNPGANARLWLTPGRGRRPSDRSPPATGGSLGNCRFGRQGGSHSDRSGTRLGKIGDRYLGNVSARYGGTTVPMRQPEGLRLG